MGKRISGERISKVRAARSKQLEKYSCEPATRARCWCRSAAVLRFRLGPTARCGPAGLHARVRRQWIRQAQGPTPTQVSEVRPLTQAVAAGTEPNEPLSATATHGTAAPKYATEQPERAAATPDHAAAAEREILERHQRWFDAFERGDRATMASLASDNFSLVDQRPERAPGASGRVERTIHDLRVQVTADIGAVLSGRIAETTTADDAPATTVAMLSEVWIRRGEEWQLVSVRMVPLNAIPATLQ